MGKALCASAAARSRSSALAGEELWFQRCASCRVHPGEGCSFCAIFKTDERYGFQFQCELYGVLLREIAACTSLPMERDWSGGKASTMLAILRKANRGPSGWLVFFLRWSLPEAALLRARW